MEDGLQISLVRGLCRRALLLGCLASPLLSYSPASRASNYLEFKVRAPHLEARYRNWWNRTESYAQDLAISENPSVVQFRTSLAAISGNSGLIEFFAAVNNAVNGAATYIEDYNSGRGRDQWATPIEFLEHGGDCEDFALTKAATLLSLGWPLSSTYLLVGILDRPPRAPVGHAVLVAVLSHREESHLVLDNISNRIVSLQCYRGFRPVFGLQRQGITMLMPPID